MKLNLFLIIYASIFNYTENANILAVFQFPGGSHFNMFQKILERLAEKGHQVDVMSHFPLKQHLQGYNDLSLKGTLPIYVNQLDIEVFENISRVDMLNLMFDFNGIASCQAMFESDVARQLKNSSKKYDILLSETFCSDCALGWAYHFGIPSVTLTSSVSLPWDNDRYGNPDNPSYIPTYETGYSTEMSLYERIVNTYHLISAKWLYHIYSHVPCEKLAKDFFGPGMPSLEDLIKNVSLTLVNSHYSINQARPTVPNYVEVAGVHIKEPEVIDKHYDDLLSTNINKGVIYLSMGSMVKTEKFEFEKLQGLLDAFSELPYKVLWKATKESFPEGLRFPKNVVFEKWTPQLQILCHPNVKLFISHGGLMGSQEAMYCGVPLIGIPLFSDQYLNIKQLETKNMAVRVKFDDISKESILEAVTKIVNNSIYQESAEFYSKIFKDRPMSAMDTAVYWIEYVIRHKGAVVHLRSVGADLPWYKYTLLDVVFVSIVIPTALISLLLKFILKKICSTERNVKNKSE